MTAANRSYPQGDFLSGFGGSYEAGCQALVLGGLDWLDEHPDADPQFGGFRNVFGIVQEENADAKALTKAMIAAADKVDANGGVTGAMHHQAVLHILHVRMVGWDTYLEELIMVKGNKPQ